MAGLILAGGCRSKPGPGGVQPDLVDPEDIPMGDRDLFSMGQRITDVNFETVAFDYDSFKIKPSEVGKIEQVAVYMSQNRKVVCVLEGHCDERGSNEYNLSLGEQRAQAVRAHLVGLGVGAERLQTRSFGEEKPLDAGHNETAWAKNRRVEFALFR